MVMPSRSAILLVAVFVVASLLEVGQAVCCINLHSLYCADCKKRAPVCGVGSCNFFGCACQGGCRKSEDCVDTVHRIGSLYSYCRCDKKRAVDNVPYARAVFSDMDKKEYDGSIYSNYSLYTGLYVKYSFYCTDTTARHIVEHSRKGQPVFHGRPRNRDLFPM